MSETKSIQNSTSFTRIGNAITIFTEYLDTSLPNIINSLIAQISGSQDNTSYIEGELVIQAKNSPEEIDFSINSKGQLILTGSSCELKGYSIVDGYLIYTG